MDDEEGKEAELVHVHRLKADHDWDKNAGQKPSELIEPDWEHVLSQSYIRALTEKGKQH